MNTDINIRNSLLALGASVLLYIAGALASNVEWLMATLMIAAIILMGLGGAFFIKATWIRNDENRGKKHWDILDSKLMN